MVEAGRLKREIKKELGVTPTMKFAGTGVLDVVVDGRTIFSYVAEHRFLEPGELARRVRSPRPV